MQNYEGLLGREWFEVGKIVLSIDLVEALTLFLAFLVGDGLPWP
jgi:hypothetical protein